MCLQGKLYICMEYAPGGNLYAFINRQKQKLPEELIWRMFIQVSTGCSKRRSEWCNPLTGTGLQEADATSSMILQQWLHTVEQHELHSL